MVDLWNWFHDFGYDAYLKNDAARLRLHGFFVPAYECRFTEPERSLALFTEGAALARQMRYHCWELFYELWVAEAYIFYIQDYRLALEQSIKAMTLAHQPQYSTCPCVGRVFRAFLDIHSFLDLDGNREQILAMIAYMEQNVALDDDTVVLIQRRRAGLCFEDEDWENARIEIMKFLDMIRGNLYREATVYAFLYWIAYRQKDYTQAYAHICESERCARLAGDDRTIGFALLAQALHLARGGDTDTAARLFAQGMDHYDRIAIKPRSAFYSVVSAYYEAVGQPERALEYLNKALAEEISIGSPPGIAECHLNRCRLKGRMGLPLDDELAAARAAAAALKKPAKLLAKLDRVAAGDYSED
jgi:tetratricopeptide (TPR) repeat protein